MRRSTSAPGYNARAGPHLRRLRCEPLEDRLLLDVDLQPFQLDGWSFPIVVSTVTGTNTEAETLTIGDEVYFDFAVINQGTDASGKFKFTLTLDDTHTPVHSRSSL